MNKENAKHILAGNFEQLLSLNETQRMIRNLGFQQYTFSIGRCEQLEEVLNLVSETYAARNALTLLFRVTPHRLAYLMKPFLSKLVKLGKCFIAMEKETDKIVASLCLEDHYDNIQAAVTWNKQRGEILINEQHQFELLAIVHKLAHYQLESTAAEQHGKLYHCTFAAKRQSQSAEKGLFSFLLYLALRTVNAHIWTDSTDPAQTRLFVNTFHAELLQNVDFSEHIFDDGTHLKSYSNGQDFRICVPLIDPLKLRRISSEFVCRAKCKL